MSKKKSTPAKPGTAYRFAFDLEAAMLRLGVTLESFRMEGDFSLRHLESKRPSPGVVGVGLLIEGWCVGRTDLGESALNAALAPLGLVATEAQTYAVPSRRKPTRSDFVRVSIRAVAVHTT